jgi:N-acetylglucosamine-6-phosphate deacetylase
MDVVLSNCRVVTPTGVLDPGTVEVSAGRIAAVRRSDDDTAAESLDLGGRWLVPGFVDIHAHGGGGASFDRGSPDEAARVVAVHRAHGTTTMLASLATAPRDATVAALHGLTELVQEGLLAGVHLEGPFLSAARCGAHDPALLTPPSRARVEDLLSAGRGCVRMVTLAPELEHGVEAVRQVVDAGALAAVGHTDGDYEVTVAAVEAGASVATHLYNAMPPMHHRAPGPVAALMEHPDVTVELINDGTHLHDAVIGVTVRSVGPDRAAFVTDAMAAAGKGDGDYHLSGRSVSVREGVARLTGGTSIAGSTLTADAALRRAVDRGLDIVDAVTCSSTTPARLLGLADTTGAVAAGLVADLVVLDSRLQVDAVMCRGEWLDGTRPPGRKRPRR